MQGPVLSRREALGRTQKTPGFQLLLITRLSSRASASPLGKGAVPSARHVANGCDTRSHRDNAREHALQGKGADVRMKLEWSRRASAGPREQTQRQRQKQKWAKSGRFLWFSGQRLIWPLVFRISEEAHDGGKAVT